MSNFEINIPEPDNYEAMEAKNRALFKKDFEKDGILAKLFIFVYLNQPVTVTEITNILNKYYASDFDRATVFRALDKLSQRNILCKASSGYVMSISHLERNDMHKRVVEKFYLFLEGLPQAFKNKFRDVNFFWIPHGEGKRYIPWCCKLLGFKFREKKEGEKDEQTID